MTSPRDTELRGLVAPYARAVRHKSLSQLVTSFGPFLVACTASYLVYPLSWMLSWAVALPAGALLLRVFIVQHDCSHGSFFASRRANLLTGRLCSLLTMTPFATWSRLHLMHHAAWNDLHRSDASDIYSACLTVHEYLALPHRRRLLYRLPRHPLVANVLLPPLIFVLLFRVPFDTPRSWVGERRSVYLTNASLLALLGTLVVLLGWQRVLMVHLSVMVVASILGVWLLTVQHHFGAARWSKSGEWDFIEASLGGSSWLALPRTLHWLTGNIGFHHVHHLNPRIPNYRLPSAHAAVQTRHPLRPVGLRDALRAPWLTLWDEEGGRLVGFRDVAVSAR